MKFIAKLTQLRNMLQWVRERLIAAGLEKDAVFKAEIASEEALVNIIEHGYKQSLGAIDIDIREDGRVVSIIIRDQGPPFDPLERSCAFDHTTPLEDREIGGLGILFIRKYMDEVLYTREGDDNVLILKKTISPSQSS